MAEMTKYFKGKDGNLYKFEVFQDDDPLNPCKDLDQPMKLIVEWGWRTEHYGNDFRTIREELEALMPNDVDTEEMSEMQMFNYLSAKCQDTVRIFPVFVYEHSGITMSMGTSNPYPDAKFDSGLGGFVYLTKEEADKGGWFFDQAEELCRDYVKQYDQYLNNQVYGYGNEENEESCWGFFSDKYGEELWKELVDEAGMTNTKFYEEDEVEIVITEQRRLKDV